MKHLKYLIILSALVGLIGECLTRVLLPEAPAAYEEPWSQQHPYIRSDWVPGHRSTRLVDGIGTLRGTMELRINEFGFRSSSMNRAKKPQGTYRIFFLGGSTTECRILPEEMTFPYLVEKKLSEALPGLRFESINGGISGYMASDVLAMLIYKVMYYQPDLIIVMNAINDLRYGTVPTYDPIRHPDLERKRYRRGESQSFVTLASELLKKSRFLYLVKRYIVDPLLAPVKQERRSAVKALEKAHRKKVQTPIRDVPQSKALGEFTKSIEEIIFITRGHGVRLILMTEPSVYRMDSSPEGDEKLWMGLVRPDVNLSTEFLFREMQRFNKATRQLSQKHNVELIELDNAIPKDSDHFYDDAHFTPKGSALATEVIASYLLQHKEKITLQEPAPIPSSD